MVVTDVPKFESAFPGVIDRLLKHPSSPRVQCQAIGRRILAKERIPESQRLEVLGPKMLNAILGVRTRSATVVTREVYALPDGTTTSDLSEFKDAWGIK